MTATVTDLGSRLPAEEGCCEVCDTDGATATFHGDVEAHPSCVPTHWRRAVEERDEFQREIERRKGKSA